MLLAAAQIDRAFVAVLDMQPDGVFVERAAGVEVGHVEHGMAAADDVEGRIEDVLSERACCFLKSEFVIPGWAEGARASNDQVEVIPGSASHAPE